jgi:hypothetical protein
LRVGVACDGAGWYAVAALSPPDPDIAASSDHLIPALAAVVRDSGISGAMLQLVTHTVPAPSTDLAPDCAAATSYRELFELVGPVPAARTQWLAVRTDAVTLATAGIRDASQASAIVAGLARRAAREATWHGRPATILTPDGLLAALAHSCGLNPGSENVAAREEWNAWHSGRLAHRSFWLRDWPQASAAAALFDRLTVTPAAMTSLALVITGDGTPDQATEAIDIRCLIRIATRPSDLPTACARLTETARTLDAALTALDGEQAPATYASAPTGGGPT